MRNTKLTASLLGVSLLLMTGCDLQKIEQETLVISRTEAETVTEPETTAPTEALSAAEEQLAGMTLEEKIYQMFIVTPELLTDIYPVTAAGETTRIALEQQPVGGLIYFSENLVSVEQTKEMIRNSQQFAMQSGGIGLYIAVDEEGGIVSRAANKLGTTAFSPMAVYGERNDWDEAYSIGNTIGKDLKALGFNLDFAPVADVNLSDGNELGSRIFSADAEVTANMVSGVVTGMQDSGISATLKHFPGLGAEDGNAHTDRAILIDRTLEELRAEEFVPFRSGIAAGADFVMVSHQIMTGLDDDMPADLSYTVVTELLKEELGFEGIAITDSQQMNTISEVYDPGEAAVRSIQAGMDMILMPTDLTSAVQGVLEAVSLGTLTEERIDQSVLLILEHKDRMGLLQE